jgi:hypothetical protein
VKLNVTKLTDIHGFLYVINAYLSSVCDIKRDIAKSVKVAPIDPKVKFKVTRLINIHGLSMHTYALSVILSEI